jgi:flavodoxin
VLSITLFPACTNTNAKEEGTSTIKVTGKTLVVYFSKTLPDGVNATTGVTDVVKKNGKTIGATMFVAEMAVRKISADISRITVIDNSDTIDL